MNFFNERASIEAKYGESLMKLGRSGGAVKLGSVGKQCSLMEYKNFEGEEMNSLLTSILESSLKEG